jgi:uncharacterized cupin superfamily protein
MSPLRNRCDVLRAAGCERPWIAAAMNRNPDGSESVLRARDCAAFRKGAGIGHHLPNTSAGIATYMEVGSRNPPDLATCSGIDLKSANADGKFVRKDATPYSSSE